MTVTPVSMGVYRFYNGTIHDHLLTADFTEANGLTTPWVFEAVTFRVSCSDTVPVYRARLTATGQHFYTADASEYSGLSGSWTPEGVSFYVVSGPGTSPGNIPVHRLYHSADGHRLWTWDPGEIQSLVAAGWADQGISWFVTPQELTNLPAPPAHTPAPSPAPSSHLPVVTITSFGASFGKAPSGQKYLADVAFNGHAIPNDGMGFTAGNNARDDSWVYDLVMAQTNAQWWLAQMNSKWTPNLKNGDHVAIGCSRGHHRSVAVQIAYGAALRAHGFSTVLVYRDINKSW